MTSTIRLFLAVLVIVTGSNGRSFAEPVPSWETLRPGSHDVGFRLVEETDTSRAIRAAGASHPRPVRIYVWYPATASRDARPMVFGRYAAMADERRAFARSLGQERYGEFLQRTVAAVENAKPAQGPFPLIVVATAPLLGTDSPLVHLDVADLESQVRDMEFVTGVAAGAVKRNATRRSSGMCPAFSRGISPARQPASNGSSGNRKSWLPVST